MPNPVVARLTTPAQIVAVLPRYLGYVPTESLVVVCQEEPRGRLGLTMRFDLPVVEDEPDLVEQVVARVRLAQPSRLLLAVFTEEPGAPALPRTLLVDSVLDALPEVEPTDALLVRAGRFWSYLCDNARCCPPAGRPVDESGLDDDQVGLLAAELVLQGRATMPSREALESSIAGPTGRQAEAARRHCGTAFEDLQLARDAGERDAYIEQLLVLWSATAVRFSLPRPELHPDDAAALAVSLGDKELRDVVATRFDVPGMRELLAELCRRTPAPWDVPLCTLLAWAAYCEGGGAEVTIALERALGSEPDYELALLLREALLSQADPRLIRQITRDVAADERIRRWAV
jgi:hypothetical protein